MTVTRTTSRAAESAPGERQRLGADEAKRRRPRCRCRSCEDPQQRDDEQAPLHDVHCAVHSAGPPNSGVEIEKPTLLFLDSGRRIAPVRGARPRGSWKGEHVKKLLLPFAAAALAILAAGALGSGSATADITLSPRILKVSGPAGPEISSVAEFRDVQLGTGLTECPQAGSPGAQHPKALDRRNKDRRRAGFERRRTTAGPTTRSTAASRRTRPASTSTRSDSKNAVGGANDYRLGWATSGFYASTDNGEHWYDGAHSVPVAAQAATTSTAAATRRSCTTAQGVVYYADINFNRTDDTNGVLVSSRSTQRRLHVEPAVRSRSMSGRRLTTWPGAAAPAIRASRATARSWSSSPKTTRRLRTGARRTSA